MTTFNTGNPIGSSDPRDLYDNAENADFLINGDQPAYNDRKGVSRKSWTGVEQQVAQQASEFAADQSARETTFANFLNSSGFDYLGEYAAGLTFTEYNQYVVSAGEAWFISPSTALPYTTTGAGLPEGGALMSRGEAVLRQELGSGIRRVDSLAGLQAISGRFSGDVAYMVGRTTAGDGGEGEFRWDASDLSATLVLASVTSTSVDATTDTITKTAHGLLNGYGVITATAVNGLNANQVYWVVGATADTFQLSATFGGAAVDLTGTTNFTAQHLLDPLHGVYVCDDRTGAGGAWVRKLKGNIKSEWFGRDTAALSSSFYFSSQNSPSEVCVSTDYSITSTVNFSANNSTLRFLGGGAITYSSETLTALKVSGENTKVIDATINAPAVFDGANVTPTYASIMVLADGCSIVGATINNVPKVGLMFKDCNNGKFLNGKIYGGTAEGFFTGSNTGHSGVLIDAPSTGPQGNFSITSNLIANCVQGVLVAGTGGASFEQSISCTGNVFNNCWNHGYYCSGLGNGHTVSGNAFNSCQIPVAMTGSNHCVSNNTMITQGSGTGSTADKEITGISMRDPYGCTITGNTLKGDGTPGGAIISLEDGAVSGANEVANNVVCGNVIEIKNPTVSDVNAIRLLASSSNVRNNIVSSNTIIAPSREFQGIISLFSSSGSASSGNIVESNSLVINGSAGDCFGIYLVNIVDSSVSNNVLKVEFDSVSPIAVSLVALSSGERVSVQGNKLICSSAWGGSINLRGFNETGTCVENKYYHNTVDFDPTKIASSTDFLLQSTSGSRVDHFGEGSPEGIVAAGVGSVWHRKDGGAGTSMYVKESLSSATGWVGK